MYISYYYLPYQPRIGIITAVLSAFHAARRARSRLYIRPSVRPCCAPCACRPLRYKNGTAHTYSIYHIPAGAHNHSRSFGSGLPIGREGEGETCLTFWKMSLAEYLSSVCRGHKPLSIYLSIYLSMTAEPENIAYIPQGAKLLPGLSFLSSRGEYLLHILIILHDASTIIYLSRSSSPVYL